MTLMRQARPATRELWIGAAHRSTPPKHIAPPVRARDVRRSPDGKYLPFTTGYSVRSLTPTVDTPAPSPGRRQGDEPDQATRLRWIPAHPRTGISG